MRRMFTEKQVKEMSAEGISEGSLQNVDLEVKTLSVENANWELDLTDKLNSDLFAEGSSLFAKIQIFGKEMYIVIAGKFINGSDTGGNTNIIPATTIELPDEIASKIFRADGTNLTQSPTSSNRLDDTICGFNGIRQTSNYSSLQANLRSQAPKSIFLEGYNFGTHNEGGSYYMDIRTTLIL